MLPGNVPGCSQVGRLRVHNFLQAVTLLAVLMVLAGHFSVFI